MLMEIAIGDAYAVAWEFVPESQHPRHGWDGYQQRPMTSNRRPPDRGSYTDDTLRSLANARVLLAGEVMNPLAYIREIKRVFREDPRFGWSKAFTAFLTDQLRKPDTVWLDEVRGRDTNGALMGAAVMGLLPSADAAIRAGRLQARVTHDETAAEFAAALSLAAYGLRSGDAHPRSLISYIASRLPDVGDALWDAGEIRGPVDMSAKMTTAAILQVVKTQVSLKGMMDEVVQMGGDTDSVAAAAFGLASLAPSLFDLRLPTWAYTGLESCSSDPMTLQRLRDTDRALFGLRSADWDLSGALKN